MTYAELLEIELFVHLTVCKQMTDIWLNCYWYIAMHWIINCVQKEWD